MNRSFLFLVPVLLFLSSGIAPGQSDLFDPDSPLPIPDSLQHVGTLFTSMGSCGRFILPHDQPFGLWQDSAEPARLVKRLEFIGQCKDFTMPEIDFSRYALIGMDFFIDCNGQVRVSVRNDTAARVYRIFADIHDGLCRGMTSRDYWLLVPALPEGYRVEMVTRRFERSWEDEVDGRDKGEGRDGK